MKVKAHITVLAGLEPQAVNFGEAKVGQKITRSVELVGSEAAGVELTLGETSDDALVATVRTEDGKTWVDVTLDPKRPRQLKGRLQITTSHPKVPQLQLRVHGRIVGNVRVSPHSISIRDLDGQPQPGLVVLSSEQDGFQVESATDPKGKVDVTVAEIEGKWRIEATPKKIGEGAMSFRTHVEVKTNDPLQPTIEVPVVARTGVLRGPPGRTDLPSLRPVPTRRGATDKPKK